MRIFHFNILISIALIIIAISLYKNIQLSTTTPSKPDQCMSCHKSTTPMDKSHPYEIFGCFKCHGGNKFATDKKNAHKYMVLNPSRLEHANRFCGECHSEIIKRVKNSIMQTQNGILGVLEYQWKEKKSHKNLKGIEELKENNQSSIAQNHFRKACGACHINQNEKIFDNQKYARGGGCVDCHRVAKKEGNHPKLSTKIPSSNCLKCHNRSNRIGLSYFGKFESEGYGTPYKNGNFSNKLDDSRSFYQLPADIHHTKVKMECIDCHSEKGVMGDKKRVYHMEEAVDINCKDCHKPKFKKADKLAIKLSDLNQNIPMPKDIAYTSKKNSPLYNLQIEDKNISFYRKLDGKAFKLSKMSNRAYHSLDIHKRLDCSACHSSWMPSCYGCHEVYFENGKQFDWVEKKITKGEWKEFRSFLRFESPSLGVGYNKKIMPFAPGCQVIGTLFKDKKIKQFHSMAMAGWDPHTTQKKSRECIDCHFNPATLGLGRGILDIKDKNITFSPFYNSTKSGQPFNYPIDGFISTKGKQFQTTSRKNARGFNKKELIKIIEAYKCIICHRDYDDKIYKDFNKSKKLFYDRKSKCFR